METGDGHQERHYYSFWISQLTNGHPPLYVRRAAGGDLRRLAAVLSPNGTLVAETVGTPDRWIAFSERVSLGIESRSGLAVEFESWAEIPRTPRGPVSPTVATVGGARFDVSDLEPGVILDVWSGDEYLSSNGRMLLTGPLSRVVTWFRVGTNIAVGADLQGAAVALAVEIDDSREKD